MTRSAVTVLFFLGMFLSSYCQVISGEVTSATPVEIATANLSARCSINSTFTQIPLASAATIKLTRTVIKETLIQKIEFLRTVLSEIDFSPETVIAKMKEKKANTEDQAVMITALEEGDAAAVQRLWLVVFGNAEEAGQISRRIKLLSALESFEELIGEQKFSADEFKDFRKTFGKNKLDKETDTKIKPILTSLVLLVEVQEQLANLRPSKTAEAVTAPVDAVTLIINPKQSPNNIFAVDEHTFLVGKKGESLEVRKDILDEFIPKLPYSEETPVTSSQAGSQITLSNPAENTESIRFGLDNETKTLSAGETQSYPIPKSGQVKIFTAKTRSVSSGRRRGSSQSQTYQDSQSFPVAAGLTYDFQPGSESSTKLVVRPIQITLDNRDGALPFYLIVEDQPVTVPPLESKTFSTENGTIKIQFTRSEESNDTASFDFYESKTYKPAISKTNGKWSLFPAQ